MKQDMYRLAIGGLFIAVSFSALLGLVGCANTQARVMPVTNRDVAALSADDIVRVMLRAGFSDKQILELGKDLRNELAQSGAAQISIGDKVEGIFAVDSDRVYVSSRLRGSFICDLREKKPAVNQ